MTAVIIIGGCVHEQLSKNLECDSISQKKENWYLQSGYGCLLVGQSISAQLWKMVRISTYKDNKKSIRGRNNGISKSMQVGKHGA